MMDDLEKIITGKWLEIRENSKDIYTVHDYFSLPAQTLQLEIEKLSNSVELGVIEYKRNIINAIFRQMGNIKYKALDHEMLKRLANLSTSLLYVLLLQRLIASGLIRMDKEKSEDKVSAENIEINLILKDILARVKENPDFSKKPAVKNILLQFTIYKNEKDTLKKLSTSNKEKTNSFYQNFKTIFERIFASIRRNYAEILKEEASQFARPNLLAEIQDKALAQLILNQAKEASRILATLEFVQQEKYKTREILIKLYDSRNILFGFVEQELKYYQEFYKRKENKEKIIATICLNFAREIGNLITKYRQ